MLTCHDAGYSGLADITVPNKIEYCKRWGYSFGCKTEGFAYPNVYSGKPSDLLIGFEKLHMVLETFERNPELDWIHWTGADVIVTNMTVQLESIIDDTFSLIICADGNGLNVDSMLIKNDRMGKGLMQWILSKVETYRHSDWYEQRALIDFYTQVPLANHFIKVIPQRVMNSYEYDLYPDWVNRPHLDTTGNDGDWKEGDFIFQVPGLPIQQRIDVINRYAERVIR